jgi:hypothetical protein
MTETPYRPTHRPARESADELRARIPGWGADLDPADRPSGGREREVRPADGTHWEIPPDQPARRPRERSIEHSRLTPVFGTSCPPRGLSGALRKLAYARYSEARAAHWLLLLGADRVDSAGQTLRSFVSTRPDNPVAETGIRGELTRHGWSSRIGRRRVDVAHHPIDPVIVGLPWVAGAWLGYRAVRGIRDRLVGSRG